MTSIDAYFQIDLQLPLVLWRTHRRDFYVWMSTLFVCLVIGVELGLVFGITMNILHLLYLWARPTTVVVTRELNNMQYISVRPSIGVFFPGIDNLREQVKSLSTELPEIIPVVVDFSRITGLDYTSKMVIQSYK